MTGMRKAFAEAIRESRQRSGLSQEAFAERAGVHRTYVSEVERGLRNISLDNIEKFAEALETPISTLFAAAEKQVAQ